MGAYCVAKTADGDYLVTTMSATEIEAVRQTSKAATGSKPEYSPWSTFPMEMWKKTVIKRAAKTWPKTDVNGSDTLTHAIDVLNEHEGLQEECGATSEEATDFYAQLIDEKNSLGLYMFVISIDVEQQIKLQSEYVNIHAEPRGKGAMRAELKDLFNEGKRQCHEYVFAFEQAGDDVSAIEELEAELSEDEIAFIKDLT